MQCIVCDKENQSKTIEHIVSESLGNKDYTIESGRICDDCNARFSKFESVALTNSIFIMERARLGIPTKKGRNAKGKIAGLEITGHEGFIKNLITVKGITVENLKNFDPQTRIGQLYVKSFDKSEVAASKLLLKTGIEALFTSQKNVYEKNDFAELKRFLTNQDNSDWPFLTTDIELSKFQSIPTYIDKHKLNKIRCRLTFSQVSNNTLLFKFKYGAVAMVINLFNRNLDWIDEYLSSDETAQLYPEHYRKKLPKSQAKGDI